MNGPNEVKNHPWIKNYPWDDLKKSRVKSPFIPPVRLIIIIEFRIKTILMQPTLIVIGKTRMKKACKRVKSS